MWVQDENGEWFEIPDEIRGEEIKSDRKNIPALPRPLERYPNLHEKYPQGIRTGSLLGGSYIGNPEQDMEDYLIRQKEAQATRDKILGRDQPSQYVTYERPKGFHPDYQNAQIIGYGTRSMYRHEGMPEDTPWMRRAGVEASPEYIMDVIDTMKDYDRGEMSETQLREKIKGQEKPPGRKPTEGEINIVDFVNFHMNEVEPKLREQAKEARKAWEKTVSYSTRSLNEAVFDSKGATLEEQRYNELRNEEKALATKHAERLQRVDDARKGPKTTTDLIRGELRKKFGREPDEKEILERTAEFNAISAGQKAGASEQAKLDTQKGMVTDADVANYAKYVATSGEFPPEFNRLFRLPQVQLETMKRVTALLNEQGFDGADRAVQAAAYKAGKVALNFQEKQLGSARSFALNIEGQAKRVEEIMSDVISRVGVRAIDLPVRELKTRFAGSGQERVLESYLMEISREIGKLSTGSQASIAELSVEAQKKWDKIHDPNLSLKELKEVLNATKEQAGIRIKSMDDALKIQMERLRETPMRKVGGKPRLTPEQAREALKQRGK